MRGLIGELKANPWYRRVYVVQVVLWLGAVILREVAFASADSPLEQIIDAGVTMSFLAYGALAASVIMVDAVQYVWGKGKEIMGILIPAPKNRFVEQGIRIGEARGRREMAAESAAWLADKRQAEKEGREFNEPPPWERDG